MTNYNIKNNFSCGINISYIIKIYINIYWGCVPNTVLFVDSYLIFTTTPWGVDTVIPILFGEKWGSCLDTMG